MNWSFIGVVLLLVALRVFLYLYRAYSKQRLRRKLQKIHRE